MTPTTVQRKTIIRKDVANKKIFVERTFNGSLEQVWKAWTDSSLLDIWWAPKPWKANTKSMDFREGGRWLYYMEGPDGTKAWCCVDYQSINFGQSFTGMDAFCDEAGNISSEFPTMHWNVEFIKTEDGTKVNVEITFASVADLEKIVEMGFEEGFAMAHGNLDELLEQ